MANEQLSVLCICNESWLPASFVPYCLHYETDGLLALPSLFGQALEQAQEVQSGLWLLQEALSSLRSSATNTVLQNHIDNSIRNLHSINAVLRSLNIQVSNSRFRGQIQKH